MPFRRRNIARELSTAIAVLALYVLVLLAPLHQAAGLQRDLSDLGYATADSWSICAPLVEGQNSQQSAVVKCAAAGIGKHDLALAAPVPLTAAVVRIAAPVAYPLAQHFILPTPHHLSGQPRAPPTTV